MATTAASIVEKTRYLTLDVSGIRWTDSEMLAWVNDGQIAIVTNKPTAKTTTAAITMVAGTIQTVPAGHIALLDITHNTGSGEPCTLVERGDLDRSLPGWVNVTAQIDAEHYMVDEDDPKTYFCYPPNTGAGSLNARTSVLPTPLTALTENIDLTDEYAPILMEYLLHRIWAKNTNVPQNFARARTHQQEFLRSLGVKIQADMAYSPRRNAEDARGAV